jgi:Restriction endonuclease
METSTTKKGDLFEQKVYDVLFDLLAQDKLFIPSNRALLFKKHKYFSKDREKDIVFDLVIESYREGANSPNVIVLIECKDKGRAISIEDIESFYSKKEQVARANCKCIFFTTSELQESAFNFAINLGIGVVRIFDDDSVAWLIERTNKNLTTSTANTIAINVISALTNEFFVTTYHTTFAFFENKAFTKIDEMILEVLAGQLK